MRTLCTVLLLTTAIVLPHGTAQAWGIYFADTQNPRVPDENGQVSVDVMLDVDVPGVFGFLVAILYDPTELSYDQLGSSAASYILYSPAEGKSAPSVYMLPSPDPPELWTGTVPPGKEAVALGFNSNIPSPTRATGTGILLATLVFDVLVVDYLTEIHPEIALDVSSPWNSFFVVASAVGGDPEDVADVKSQVVLGENVRVVPEPTTALLLGLGAAVLAVARRRRAI